MLRVREKDWNAPKIREEVTRRIQESFNPGAQTGLDAEAYAMVDNFRADAMECFNRHQRNPDCSEYKGAHKRLVPDTKTERKELGLHPRYDQNPSNTRYLCEYCPVHSLVQQAARKKAGLYDK